MAINNRDMSFLWLKRSLEDAWDQSRVPVLDFYYRRQLHLLPFDPQPYIQITDSPTSIYIGTTTVTLLDCSGEEANIDDHVDIGQLTDEKGVKQAYIRLKYLPLDYGMNLVCLKIHSVMTGEDDAEYTYYSNPFLLTSLGYDRTSRVDYKINRTYAEELPRWLKYQSARLNFYHNRHVDATELDNYYQITRQQDVIANVNENDRIEWMWEQVDAWHWVRLSKALYRSPCYINLERQYPSEGLELQPREGDTQISESSFITSPNPDDTLNIIEIIIIPGVIYVPFLASSSALSSEDYLVSQEEIPQP